MQPHHVITVQEGVLDQFPVAGDRPDMLFEEMAAGHVECVQVPVEIGQVRVQVKRPVRRRLGPDQAAAYFGGQGCQAHPGGVDVGKTLAAGDMPQSPVQAIGPLVVGADQGTQTGLGHCGISAWLSL